MRIYATIAFCLERSRFKMKPVRATMGCAVNLAYTLESSVNPERHKRKCDRNMKDDGFVTALKKQCLEGQLDGVLQGLEHMNRCGVNISHKLLYCLIQGCIDKKDLAVGCQLHSFIVRCGLESDAFLGSHLIRMFSCFGSLSSANLVFSKLHEPTLFTWSAIILAHVNHGQVEQAFDLFKAMLQSNIEPDGCVFVVVLKACAGIGALAQGKVIHSHLVDMGFELNIFVGNTLITMYANCGSLEDGYAVFDKMPKQNTATWNAMIAAYAQQGIDQQCALLFQQMQQAGVKPNNITYVCILKSCSSIALDQVRSIYNHITGSGWESDAHVGSTLMDVYCKLGDLEDAQGVFDKLPRKDVVTWSIMIAGLVQHGYGQDALLFFQKMQNVGIRADKFTYVSVLKACSTIAALDRGKLIHAYIVKNGSESDVFIESALIDMYANCEGLVDACRLFNGLPQKDVVTWNAIIGGCATNSSYDLGLLYLEEMEAESVMPDEVTFVSLLSACSHMGLVDEGWYQLKSMIAEHGITPTVEHYNCIVDLLGRSGHLNEAESLLQNMPLQPTIAGWMCLLSSCRTFGDIEVGMRCFHQIVLMDHRHASAYILMSSIYSIAGMWDDAAYSEELRECVHAWKKPGKAFIEVGLELHEFVVEDRIHPQTDVIYGKLKSLELQMCCQGHIS